jgi:hypothetical protein
VGISKDRLGRFVRAAVVSGLLGAAGLTITATSVYAQSDPSDPPAPSDPSDPSDPGTTGGTTGGTTDGTTTDGSDLGVAPSSGGLPDTGGSATAPLALGGAAIGVALAGRRLLAAKP